MNKPKAVILNNKEQCPDNFVKSKFNTGVTIPEFYSNNAPVNTQAYESILLNQAQEAAYWAQFGTASFALN